MQNDACSGMLQGNLGVRVGKLVETYIHPASRAATFWRTAARSTAASAAVFASTNEIDAAGSNIPWGNVTATRVEDAYAGWRSGDCSASWARTSSTSPSAGSSMSRATASCSTTSLATARNRGAFWMGERQAAKFSGIVKLKSGDWKVDLIYLEADDNPNTTPGLGGITLDYTFGEAIGGIGAASTPSHPTSRRGIR